MRHRKKEKTVFTFYPKTKPILSLTQHTLPLSLSLSYSSSTSLLSFISKSHAFPYHKNSRKSRSFLLIPSQAACFIGFFHLRCLYCFLGCSSFLIKFSRENLKWGFVIIGLYYGSGWIFYSQAYEVQVKFKVSFFMV